MHQPCRLYLYRFEFHCCSRMNGNETLVDDTNLNAKCLAEFLGTAMGIYFGDSIVANALLPNAKGQSMGFGWIS